MSNIKLLVLSNGQVLIGTVNKTVSLITIDKPLALALQMTQDGRLNVQMMDYLPIAASEKFEFTANHVMTIAEPQASLVQTYRQKMSGLVLPEGPQLIT